MSNGRTAQIMRSLTLLVFVIGSLSPLLPFAPMPAWAQDAGAPIFEITGIDYSQLPAIRVTAYGRDLGDDLALLPVTLFEDNVEQPVLDSNVKAVGTQTALFLDLSDSVLDRYPDIAAAIERFPEAKLEVNTDWLAAYAVDAAGSLRVITGFAAENEGQGAPEWAQDHQLVANSVRAFAPTEAPTLTPLLAISATFWTALTRRPPPPASSASWSFFRMGVIS